MNVTVLWNSSNCKRPNGLESEISLGFRIEPCIHQKNDKFVAERIEFMPFF